MKVLGFVGSIVLFIVSVLLTIITYYLSNHFMTASGIAVISALVLIPLIIMFFVILASVLISGTIGAIRSIGSDIKGIKITAIILLILYAGLIIFNAILALKIFGNL